MLANSVEFSCCKSGALVCGGSALSSPGIKKVAGETLWLALMPLQPAADKAVAVSSANNVKFQFNFTVASINYPDTMATFNSHARRAMKCGLAAAFFLLAAGIVFADETQNKIFAARAEAEFHRAQIRFLSDTNNATNVWQFARACYNFADFATNNAERAAIADQGIAACRQSLAHKSNSAPVHYYLAMNLGQLARTEFLGALKLVREMEREFKTAAGLDAQFDFAGPERDLGLLYRDAPGWPASIGSERKAKNYLDQAEKLAPDYPENRLNLVESFLQWHEKNGAKQELDALDALWPEAQKEFTGEKWEQSWDDWTTRRAAARKKLEEVPAPVKPSKSGQ